MSLVDFVKTPSVRAAYARHAVKRTMRLPPAVYGVPCMDTRMSGAIGTAFDYLVRFRLAALCRSRGIICMEGEWVAESAVRVMHTYEYLSVHADRWGRMLQAARNLHLSLSEDRLDKDTVRLVKCVQYLGAADLLLRVGTMRADFEASDKVSMELSAMDSLFDYASLLPDDGQVLYLNPVLMAGRHVGGADPDLISGAAIIDVKTTIKPAADSARLLQVCGYAALCDWEGLQPKHIVPITHVGFAFSRQGLVVRYPLTDLFGDGYPAFRDEVRQAALDMSTNSISRTRLLPAVSDILAPA